MLLSRTCIILCIIICIILSSSCNNTRYTHEQRSYRQLFYVLLSHISVSPVSCVSSSVSYYHHHIIKRGILTSSSLTVLLYGLIVLECPLHQTIMCIIICIILSSPYNKTRYTHEQQSYSTIIGVSSTPNHQYLALQCLSVVYIFCVIKPSS